MNQARTVLITFFCAMLFFCAACGDSARSEREQRDRRKADSLRSLAIADSIRRYEDSLARLEYLRTPHYSRYVPGRAAALDSLRELGDTILTNVLALNRLDVRHIRLGDTLVMPDSLTRPFIEFAPWPDSLALLDSVAKMLLFSYRVQAFGAYEFGKLVYWGPTSMGKRRTPTPLGLFYANWKARRAVSTVDASWILPWNVNIDNFRGISMHQFDLPGYPASHACTRLLMRDAYWVYHWVDTWVLEKGGRRIAVHGTPVLVFGAYDFDARPPWQALPDSTQHAHVQPEELAPLREALPDIMQKETLRMQWQAAQDSSVSQAPAAPADSGRRADPGAV